MTRLVIIGAGGHGKVIADTANATNQWSEIVFLDDRYVSGLSKVAQWSIIGKSHHYSLLLNVNDQELVGIGNNVTREKLVTQL